MRRIVFCLTMTLAALAFVAGPAGAQSSSDGSGTDAGGHSIIGSPDGEGTNNIGGLVVGTVLLGGWLAGGALLVRSGRRRRAALASAPHAG
jgi:hypothetical protein